MTIARRASHSCGPRGLTALRRTGELLEANGVRHDLSLDALIEPTGWRTGRGPALALDPVAIGLLVRCATEIRAERFMNDAPDSLADYALDPPALRVELMDVEGRVEALRFGSPPEARGRWFAVREGWPTVFEVQAGDVSLLQRPLEALYDLSIVRVLRESIVAIELRRGDGTLLVQRSGRRLVAGAACTGWGAQATLRGRCGARGGRSRAPRTGADRGLSPATSPSSRTTERTCPSPSSPPTERAGAGELVVSGTTRNTPGGSSCARATGKPPSCPRAWWSSAARRWTSCVVA